MPERYGDPPGGVSALEQQLDFPVLIPAALVVIFRSAGTRELATNMMLERYPTKLIPSGRIVL